LQSLPLYRYISARIVSEPAEPDPSGRQNSGTDTPLLACRENSSRHIAALRLMRLMRLIFPIIRSSCQKPEAIVQILTQSRRTPRGCRLLFGFRIR